MCVFMRERETLQVFKHIIIYMYMVHIHVRICYTILTRDEEIFLSVTGANTYMYMYVCA